ncbi:thiamine-phosphate kinase [Legionella oakridgensis]|uniref:Thiamine-monophosphate kinase n=2 Tax=Legionella oakridgensis TaxID=29423 RepID=W0B9P0_9GAMM|nr:thiamine-phosphate kinase [Legionella oakridgensis]AHE66580.1 thiamine-monophosphate kinase [Legionella oakridgensis ATCC 33761 = DSM 21215]ETO93671.1 thiamine-phosphate kinase [Legionella oakridgensis RV-2-2007]KTD37818.1 Thiamine-monophosphate kinase [Legionella oakridgensis]STY19729.1 Thiamine-monophosphate kinase [Legionella longbeachae]
MNEFSLIQQFFKSLTHDRDDVIIGIGDDAACLVVPPEHHLLVSCDTLVADVHFLSSWDPYDIAYKAVMVNVSDLAAMAATPAWMTLALTLPECNELWLQRFSLGLHDALRCFNIALVGGDTTHGPLSMTITIHGVAPKGKEVRRGGASPGDKIFVSGQLGAAAQAVSFLNRTDIADHDKMELMKKLLYPKPRIDLQACLQTYATAAIDISDGLSADLNHICEASNTGACLILDNIPIHPLVKNYQADHAIDFALSGGDDYELCFTVSPVHEKALLEHLKQLGLNCYFIGEMENQPGLRATLKHGEIISLTPKGYSHF